MVLPLRFVPYHLLDGVPNVVVDGSANASTRLTLSHWPASPTPVEVRDDLSAQIAFRALAFPSWFEGIDAVTNNHFDQDGLCSAWVLVDPDAATARHDLVVDVASAGDFGTFASRDAARLAFAIAAYEDPSTTPLDSSVFAGSSAEQCGLLYQALLPRMAELLDHPDRSRRLWEAEDAHLDASLEAVRRGVVKIEERPAVDLAVITIPPDWAERDTHRFTQSREDAVHPMALNQSTRRLRLLTMQGTRYRLEFRYESWVMYRSRPVMRRPDLRVLAARLNELETGRCRWIAQPPGALTPSLESGTGDSDLSPERFLTVVEGFLATAPPAWDPDTAA